MLFIAKLHYISCEDEVTGRFITSGTFSLCDEHPVGDGKGGEIVF